MSLEQWKKEIEELKAASNALTSVEARSALYESIRKLRKKVEDEENRLKQKLEVKIIDGVEVEIPQCFYFDNEKLSYVDGIIYAIDNSGKLDKDGSYHWYHYAWIPNGNKFTKLLVRTLGKDRFGDRYYAETSHYKHPADPYSYQTRHLYIDNRTYKPYIEYILKQIGLLGVSKAH